MMMRMRPRDRTLLMVGEMVLMLQKLEQFLLAALLGMVSADDADKELEKILLSDKETLGRLMQHFSDRVDLPEHFAEKFEDLLSRRNLLAHNLVMAPWFDLKSDEGCAVLDEYMRATRASMKVVLLVLIGVVHKEPQQSEQGIARQKSILERLQTMAEPDFGGLTEDEYVDQISRNARTRFRVEQKGGR